ncbi:tyrosine-protein phosphatase [Klebsiella oxytoca]|uniref:tyrosine-protein phosphatase n=1 Tax=Klebsiella oxytoca TaxID=571 RepID=UPI00157A9FC7|nr:tyrosine-protein phosphatase [Klebsiella oxytoca]
MNRYIPFSLSLVASTLSGALYATPINTPILSSIDNFRDIAGTTSVYTTSHDGTMRTGVFYRANALTLSAADQATLSSLGISDVYDLRTPSEIASAPDVLPDGATYTNIDIIGSGTSGSNITSVSVTSAAAAKAMMQQANVSFVSDAGMRAQFTTLFNDLASADGAALFHCTAGKDRTGWTAAMLLSIAGVDSTTIMENYLATNDYTRQRIAATLAAMPPAMAAIYEPLLGVDASYLQAGLDEITSQYGTVDNYLKEGLGLSQETIYVLRGKMVHYSQLPGQSALRGNAAQGAALLNALQNSELSGHYTAYNNYLQSAIDAGTLGGVESQVGGQIYADTASYLLRSGSRLDKALAPNTDSRQLRDGEGKLWLTALNGYLGTDGSSRAASSNEHSTGTLLGYTQRVNAQLSAYGTVGYSWGSLSSANAEADANTTLVGIGTRYAFEDLAHGPFAAADLNAGWVDYSSTRRLNGGLGTASGDTHGQVVGGTLRLGYVSAFEAVSVESSIGTRLTHLRMDAFHESGSELALDVDSVSENSSSGLAGVNLAFNPHSLGNWTLSPAVNIGYEHFFSGPSVSTGGQVYRYEVRQHSAYDSRDIVNAGANIGLTRGALSLNLGGQAEIASGGDSHGYSGNLSVAYAF